jgi:hypothetical protein
LEEEILLGDIHAEDNPLTTHALGELAGVDF